MDQEFKDYCVFPVGSYWIYQHSLSGSIDSINLYRQEILLDNTTESVPFNYEYFMAYFSSSYFQDTLWGVGGAADYLYTNSCVYAETFFSDIHTINNTFFSNKDSGSVYKNHQNIKTQYEGFYDSLNFSTQWFKKVKLFKNLQREAPNLPEKIYHARNVGVIRRELFNGQVWNPIRYHIN